MTAPAVRADYDQLKAAASSFGSQAHAAQQTLQALRRELDVLQSGDWRGVGAAAFYKEMGDQVLPTCQRLADALGSAQTATLQIHQLMAEAEAEAARWLRGEGAATGAVLGGAAGLTGAAGAGAAMPEPVAPGGGSGGGGLPAEAPFGLGGLPTSKLDEVLAKFEAEDKSVDTKLADFSPEVRELVKKSPHLREQIFALEQAGVNFKVGADGQGSSFNRATQTITIAGGRTDEATVASISHEVGHARSTRPAFVPATTSMTRQAYVEANVDNKLLGEAEAQFNGAIVRAEINRKGGPDIGISGSQTDKYQAVYDQFANGDLTRSQALDQMATLMGNEKVSTPPKIPYREYYGNQYEKHWDTHIAPTRSTP